MPFISIIATFACLAPYRDALLDSTWVRVNLIKHEFHQQQQQSILGFQSNNDSTMDGLLLAKSAKFSIQRTRMFVDL